MNPSFPVARPASWATLALCASACLAHAADEATAPRLEAVTITEKPEQSYRSPLAPQAAKSAVPAKETPLSAQTVTHEWLQERGASSLGEALRTVPGLTPQVGWGAGNDRFRLRGFTASAHLKNGFKRSAFASIDAMANVERIEVLKGPASALYGAFEPGGVVQIVTKKPLAQPRTTLEFTAASHQQRHVSFDTTGPVSDTLSYRITGSAQDGGGFRDHAYDRSFFLAPVLQWKLAAQTTLTAELELGRKRAAFDRGFGNSPLFLNAAPHTNYAEPDARLHSNSALASLVLEHRLDDHWKLHAGLQASSAKADALWYPYGFSPLDLTDPERPLVNRRKQRNLDTQRDFTALAELAGQWESGAVKHHVLLGLDAGSDRWDFASQAALGPGGFPINLPIAFHRPVYGAATGALRPYDASHSTNRNIALYAQDELQWNPQWRLLVGLRYDRVRSLAQASHLPSPAAAKRLDGAASPRVGLTWTPSQAVSLYASWSQSFLAEPTGGLLRAGGLPQPSRGEQLEAGAKFSLLDGRLQPTVAVFDIRRRNGIVADPTDFDHVIQVGTQRSKGWELDAPWHLTPTWRLLASYTFLDARITHDSDTTLVGRQLVNAPRHSASLWTGYDFASGWTAALGAIYVGKRQANTSNSFALPAYTRWDASLAYRFGPAQRYRLQCTVQNLANRRYYDSGGPFVPIYPGAPRQMALTFAATL